MGSRGNPSMHAAKKRITWRDGYARVRNPASGRSHQETPILCRAVNILFGLHTHLAKGDPVLSPHTLIELCKLPSTCHIAELMTTKVTRPLHGPPNGVTLQSETARLFTPTDLLLQPLSIHLAMVILKEPTTPQNRIQRVTWVKHTSPTSTQTNQTCTQAM